METKLFIALLTLSSYNLLTINANAQGTKFSVNANRTTNFMAINTDPSNTYSRFSLNGNSSNNTESNSVTDKMNSRALYMVSEQFVFDNLSFLKKTYSIADIYFDLDEAGIRQDAIPVLDNLVSLMKENPGLSVAITAYSDSRMPKYNEKLALSRVQAANAYLISKGIQTERLLIEKHGRPGVTNPCNNDPSCSLAVQQLNRRTEFNIVYNGINLGQTN